MKKIAAIIMALMCAFAVSCGAGKSVPVQIVRQNNKTGSILSGETVAFVETVEYFEDKNVSYSVYCEIATGSYSFNVAEFIGDYSTLVIDGEVYKTKGDEVCAVIFSNPAQTYAKYLNSYLDVDFPLDAGERFQRYSEVGKNGGVKVEYYASVSPQTASSVYSTHLEAGDTIVSSYELDDSYRIVSVEYTVERKDGSSEMVARRTFEYLTRRDASAFSAVPKANDTVNVEFAFENGKSRTVEVPAGIFIEFDDGGAGYLYFSDAGRTVPFTNEKLTADTVIYVAVK